MMGDAIWTEYRNKLRSADEAVKVVKSGDWVFYSHFVMFPEVLDAALSKRVGEMENVSVVVSTGMHPAQVAIQDPEQRTFTYYSTFCSANDRQLAKKGLCYFIPGTYREEPWRIRMGFYPKPTVAMVKTTPMDNHGFFNFGTSCSFIGAAVEKADIVIVEVNEAVPRCLGGHTENVHISKVDYIVEVGKRPLAQVHKVEPKEEDKRIAELVVEEIPDGACLQLGIGGVPNTIGHLIADSDLKDLGVHSEMLCDAFVELFNRGKITNKYKFTNKNKMVYTFAMGSQELYDFLHDNPACATFPVDYTNAVENIACNDNMISINNAVQVDLYGQVCSEALGGKQISGTGGQFDFTYGASNSRGGKAFICLHSTRLVGDKKVSRIVPEIQGPCTVPRSCVFYVVTEYGKVCLKGKSVWEIAEAVISIAHPDFREDLIKAADARGLWRRSHKKA
ncbi:MAG TPA: acetyl-CoA hydrolase/transferase C-terminal domain-containing protein [Syntrophales bacterium]|nr:acetyl-CoA hydrolase/transferase C-terminal domain-containing protein [Syntrophales bacterium]HOL59352.1 acetyl-CoA hydrolase/transferase C-terminal domain-containing protein [Syntrophales bacterium]HPO35456.1 acetyl-CoA hydrolase/transferase C-terminal domain-containing protein [Syntrophales bacterium]